MSHSNYSYLESKMTISILKKKDLTIVLQEQASTLFKELNSDIYQIDLKKILENEEHIVFVVAEENNQLAGMASMALYTVISGYKGMVEDVVVSENYRGKGIGRKLMKKLLSEADKLELTEVLLFSGHHRQAAITLYKSLGFILKNSGVYRLKLN